MKRRVSQGTKRALATLSKLERSLEILRLLSMQSPIRLACAKNEEENPCGSHGLFVRDMDFLSKQRAIKKRKSAKFTYFSITYKGSRILNFFGRVSCGKTTYPIVFECFQQGEVPR